MEVKICMEYQDLTCLAIKLKFLIVNVIIRIMVTIIKVKDNIFNINQTSLMPNTSCPMVIWLSNLILKETKTHHCSDKKTSMTLEVSAVLTNQTIMIHLHKTRVIITLLTHQRLVTSIWS